MRNDIADALRSPGGAGHAILELLALHIDAGDGWLYRHSGRIEWYPHRHRYVLSTRPDPAAARPNVDQIRIDATIVEHVTHTETVDQILDDLNRRAAGWWWWHNPITDEIHISLSFPADPEHWWWAAAAPLATILAAEAADETCDRITATVGGTTAYATHPARGPRPERDSWLDGAHLIVREPASAIGTWATGTEQRELLTHLGPNAVNPDGTFGAHLHIDSRRSASIHGCRHPELGAGLQTAAHLICGQTHQQRLRRAADANTHAGLDPHGHGGWHTTRWGIANQTTFPALLIEQIQDHAGLGFGAVAAQMVTHTAARHTGATPDTAAPGATDPALLGAIYRDLASYHTPTNAPAHLGAQFHHDWQDTLDAIDAGLTATDTGIIVPPLILPENAWAAPRHATLATWGSFNALSPTVSTLETITDPARDTTYLIHTERHPHAPRATIIAVATNADDIERTITAALLTNSDDIFDTAPDWLTTYQHHTQITDAIHAWAHQLPAETLDRHRNDLLTHPGDPWARLSETARRVLRTRNAAQRPKLRLRGRGAATDRWLDTIQDTAVVDGHIAYIRSAWEAARSLVSNGFDWAHAHNVAIELRARTAARIRHDRHP